MTDEDLDAIEETLAEWNKGGFYDNAAYDVRALVEALRVERATSKQLREALARYGSHDAECHPVHDRSVAWPCTCGFGAAALLASLGDVSAKRAAQ